MKVIEGELRPVKCQLTLVGKIQNLRKFHAVNQQVYLFGLKAKRLDRKMYFK